MKEKKK